MIDFANGQPQPIHCELVTTCQYMRGCVARVLYDGVVGREGGGCMYAAGVCLLLRVCLPIISYTCTLAELKSN
ncbi:hypothetical protein J6590_071670 [Homalodisca vitripennis]|nr:hypothetical protein J6590_071670 [Homalodisca vitripennis]